MSNSKLFYMKTRFFNNKKGQMSEEVYNFIFTVFVIVFVIFSYLSVVSKQKDQTQFKHDWLGEDITLTVSALEAGPGDIRNFIYTKRDSNFDIGQFRYEFKSSYKPSEQGQSKKNKLVITNPVTPYDDQIVSTYTFVDSDEITIKGSMYAKSGMILDTKQITEDIRIIEIKGTKK